MADHPIDDLGENWCNVVISEGTLRPCDVIVAMIDTLIKSSARNRRYFHDVIVPEWSDVLSALQSDDKTDDDYEAENQMTDYLHNLLTTIAPKGCYFGASEGDGACIGFFPYETQT
jgi:hypothetical protein